MVRLSSHDDIASHPANANGEDLPLSGDPPALSDLADNATPEEQKRAYMTLAVAFYEERKDLAQWVRGVHMELQLLRHDRYGIRPAWFVVSVMFSLLVAALALAIILYSNTHR